MNEQHTAGLVADALTLMSAPAPREPFDPAGYLDGRQPPPVPYVAGPTVEAVKEFDPATYLGARALRGAFNLATVKPLVATIGGVEVVTIPLEHYAALVSPLALARDGGAQGSTVDSKGLLDIMMSLHAGDVISPDKGLGDEALGERVAAWAIA